MHYSLPSYSALSFLHILHSCIYRYRVVIRTRNKPQHPKQTEFLVRGAKKATTFIFHINSNVLKNCICHHRFLCTNTTHIPWMLEFIHFCNTSRVNAVVRRAYSIFEKLGYVQSCTYLPWRMVVSAKQWTYAYLPYIMAKITCKIMQSITSTSSQCTLRFTLIELLKDSYVVTLKKGLNTSFSWK